MKTRIDLHPDFDKTKDTFNFKTDLALIWISSMALGILIGVAGTMAIGAYLEWAKHAVK